jgi:hypothetical protein
VIKHLFILFTIIHSAAAFSDCGKLVNALLKYDPKTKEATIEQFYFTNEEFCDSGVFEVNANLEIQLVGKNKKILNQKYIFINTFSIVETLGKKNPLKFTKTKLELDPQYRNVKFAIETNPTAYAEYKIVNRSDKKLIGSGEVK